MSLEFAFLADRPDAVPIIASWYHEQWGHLQQDQSLEYMRRQVTEYLNRDAIPFILLAVQGATILGAAQLKFREMADMFPEKEHWLGGVYVADDQRGRGVGARVVERIAELAPKYGVQTLYLQTEALDGGLYTRLGWKPCSRANNRGVEVLVMERTL